MTDRNVDWDRNVETITTNLLKRAEPGDAGACRRVADVYLPLVYQWCTRRNLQEADVLDVGQQVFLKILKVLPNFQREQEHHTFRGWLRTVTENAIIDFFRRQQKQPPARGGSWGQPFLDEVPAPLEDSGLSAAEETQILYSRMVELVRAEFSDQDWQAFYLSVVEARSTDEITAALGITRNQAYLAKSRIKKRLHDEFGDILHWLEP